jgi:PAS domain S-box-containing protein
MSEKSRWGSDDRPGQTNGARHQEGASVGWRDLSVSANPITESADLVTDYRDMGEMEAEAAMQARTRALDALIRATELFVGSSGPIDDRAGTYVTELPQWFRGSDTIEARIRVGEEDVATDGFRETAAALTAATHTRTGTRISMMVVDTDRRAGTEQRRWLTTERELIETAVSLLEREVDRRELDSLERVSDGIAALDADLCYTYVNQQAEQIPGTDGDELRGEHVWDVFPEAADTVAQERLEAALETQTPRSFERYNAEKDQWFEVRIYPSDDGIRLFFTDISESKATEQTLEQILEATPAGVVILSDSGDITRANARAEELLGLSKGNIEGRRYDCPDWDIWDEDGVAIAPEDHPVTHVRETGETVQGFTHGITLPDGSDRWLSSNVTPVFDASGSLTQIVVALEDITALKRLEQLIETFHPINETLNTATTRQETEQELCELLTDTRAYQYARISEHTPGTVPTEASLLSRLESVSFDDSVVPPIESPNETNPTQAAVETGEIQVVTRARGDSRFESWRDYTLEQGLQGGAIVPFSYNNRIYGLLTLYTDRSGAFDERELALLSTLGDRIGQVLHSLETERVLHADTVTALTFRSTDTGSFFVSASAELDCTIDIIDTIPGSAETFVYYASIRGASLDALDEIAAEADCVVEMRQIRTGTDPPGGDVEIELRERSLAAALMRMGAVVKRDTITGGEAEVVCEVPLSHDIESLVTCLSQSFPDTDLVAKREYNRSEESTGEPAGQVLADVYHEELTDRQRQVLRAAAYGGFFESPRGSTATEVADALSLTQSTFSYHLRNAQQTLFEALFERL